MGGLYLISVLDSIKEGFSVSKKSLKLFPLLLLAYIVLMIFSFAFSYFSGAESVVANASEIYQNPSTIFLAILGALISTLIGAFIQAGLIGYLANQIKNHQSKSSDFFAMSKQFGLKIFLQQLVFFVFIFICAFFIAMIVGAIVAAQQQVLSYIVGAILIAVLAGVSMLIFYAPFFIVLRSQSLVDSIKQSIVFVKNNLWSFIGMILLFGVFIGPFAIVASIGPEILDQMPEMTANIVGLISGIVIAILGVFFIIFSSASYIVFYLGRAKTVGGA